MVNLISYLELEKLQYHSAPIVFLEQELAHVLFHQIRVFLKKIVPRYANVKLFIFSRKRDAMVKDDHVI